VAADELLQAQLHAVESALAELQEEMVRGVRGVAWHGMACCLAAGML
jgi:hypothetical protein